MSFYNFKCVSVVLPLARWWACWQARIHTGFHRFTEIGQIFHKKLIFNNKNFPSWNLENGLDKCFLFPVSGNLMPFSPPPLPMNQKPGKANFRELVSQKMPGGACPRAPLEACSLGPLFRKSVSIYPRSAPGWIFNRVCMLSFESLLASPFLVKCLLHSRY